MLSIAGRGTEVIVRLPVALPETEPPPQEPTPLSAKAPGPPEVSHVG